MMGAESTERVYEVMRNPLTRFGATAAALVFSTSMAVGAGGHSDSHDAGHAAMMIGVPGDPAKAGRDVEIELGEMYFSAEAIEVRKGETIRFVLVNKGEAVHEFNIGTAEMHAEHGDEMMEMMESGMLEVDRINHNMAGAMTHHDPNSALLEPGETGEVVWTFSGDAELEYSCNVPGHRESGMIGQFIVML
jgi:uncharacterized cupredoxin-like copper-binding protein